MDHQLLCRFVDLFHQHSTLTINDVAKHLSVEKNVVVKWINFLNQLDPLITKNDTEHLFLIRPCDLLNRERIWQLLSGNIQLKIRELDIHTSLASTNEFLRKKTFSGAETFICLAEHQSNGRGRRGRQWISPFGQNIYMSLLTRCHIPVNNLGMISLVTGVAVAEALEDIGIDQLKVKWPNDIYWQNQKLAGILIEAKDIQQDYADLVIGVGLNVNMNETCALSIQQSWTALNKISNDLICRSQVTAHLIQRIMDKIQVFENNGLDAFISQWKEFDYLIGKQVSVSGIATELAGRAAGINSQGELLVHTDKKIYPVRAGEISVRLTGSGES